MSRSIDRAPTLPPTSIALGVLLVAAALTACDVPNFEGPQLQDPPQGFLLRPESRAQRSMFAHLPEVHHDAWVQSLPPYSTIHINGYSGTLTVADAIEAQDSVRAYTEDPDVVFGGIEPLRIDGREAWGWEERIDTPTRGIPWVAYRAMIPYDDVTYTIEISTEDPALKSGAPGSLQAIVSTFAVGETVYNWPLIAIVATLLFFALHMLRQRSRAEAARLQSINLVKVEKKEGSEEADEKQVAAAPAMASSDSAAPAEPAERSPTGPTSTE